ncbi:MAG: thiamine pyrophosphate-binding protein [Azospirillaceae bacterium]
MTLAPPRTGARALVDTLLVHGVERAFCVPGESYLAVLDALYDSRDAIDLVVCRQEGGAAYMAEAHGKLAGLPGICFVTRGPGAANASIGVHVARQDSTPMILFVGLPARRTAGREAFQEFDLARVFGAWAKDAFVVDAADRMPELVARAFHRATAGRPGPIVVGLPEDVLVEPTDAPDTGAYTRVEAAPGADALARLRALLAAARRPLMILGGGGWSAAARQDVEAFAEANRLPVAAAFRRQDYIDNDHANYVGDLGIGPNPALAAAVRDTDLILALGTRLGEIATSDYTLLTPPEPAQTLIHVHADPDELGRVYRPALAVPAASTPAAAGLRALEPIPDPPWASHTAALRAAYEAWRRPEPMPGPVQLGEIVAWLAERLPGDAIVTNGAGNYAGWIGRHFVFHGWRGQLGPTAGAMGYGVPAAVAAKRAHPDRIVVSVNGDGCFLMNGQELSTAARYGLDVVFLVVDNAMYGTIRMHQEKTYPARVWGTDLVNPDFVALARAHGCHAERVETTDAFAPAFERALAAGGPALIHLPIDPDAISHRTTLAALRGAAAGHP